MTLILKTNLLALSSLYLQSNKLAKFLLKIPVSDYTNGYRVYSSKEVSCCLKNCGKIGDGFIILSEILLNIHNSKLKIAEIHSTFKNRIRGESSVSKGEIMIISFHNIGKSSEYNIMFRRTGFVFQRCERATVCYRREEQKKEAIRLKAQRDAKIYEYFEMFVAAVLIIGAIVGAGFLYYFIKTP